MDQKIIDEIRERGFRLTKNREAIVKIIDKAKKPITGTEILEMLLGMDLNTNRSTVYRELCFLTENNFVEKIQLADHKMYYEISKNHHHHLVCTKCKKIKKVFLGNHLRRQERLIGKKENFKSIQHSLEFYGVCNKCA